MSIRPYGITLEIVRLIQKLRTEGLTHRAIAERIGRTHDTVGKILRGQRGATRLSDGTLLNHRNRWKPRTAVRYLGLEATFDASHDSEKKP